jgi:phosphoribosyl-dephospho-CoA transferase
MNGTPLHRHQLASLTPAGWARVLEGEWDAQAQACLSHWALHRLPLVVTRQPPAPDAGIAMGLPAPTRWDRRRLALTVPHAEVSYFDEFPQAHQLTRLLPAAARAAWQRLCGGLRALGAVARVHGSFGWQQLTGLDHLRSGSDIDLWIAADDALQADAIVSLLQSFAAGRPRIDGELVFPGGAAVAWREWQAWREGRVQAVLVKRIDGAAITSCPLPLQGTWAVAQAA